MPECTRWNVLGCEKNETIIQKVCRVFPSNIHEHSLSLFDSMDEIHQIREIRVLRQLNGHPNIIFLREIIL